MTATDRLAARLSAPFLRGADRLTLELTAGGDDGTAVVAGYDFAEHIARFAAVPEPRYVVTALAEVTEATTLVATFAEPGAADRSVTRTFPAGTAAGTSAVLDLPGAGLDARLRTLEIRPAPPTSTAPIARRWAVTALLGNLARLLWAVAGERDALRAALDQLRRRSRLDQAPGATLDLIGADLSVPRFPPRPYAFETGTIALYHLDETRAGAPAADAQLLYGGTGHPSSTNTATPGAVGRFGTGYAFRAATAEVVVDHHPDFAVAATTDLTAECFVQPDPGSWTGPVLSKQAGSGTGWALAIGEFGRGLVRNVRAELGDGNRTVMLHADVSLQPGRFHHLALVVDRTAAQARLLIDGTTRAGADITGLGRLTVTAPLRIGRAAASVSDVFAGVVDEIRICRAARTAFPPVLGEGDDGYRRRLRIFQRWTLPTPAALQEAVNAVVDEVAGEPEPFVVDDTDAVLLTAGRTAVIHPAALEPGESIDAGGDRLSTEEQASGPAEGSAFDPRMLARSEDPRADYPAPESRRMQLVASVALTALLDRLSGLGDPGRVQVLGAYDPGGAGLRAVGRALVLGYRGSPTLSLGAVAAQAHLAGFTWVGMAADGRTFTASVPVGDTIAITGAPPDGEGFDLLTGRSVTLAVNPVPPVGARFRWSVIHCGAGRVTVEPRPDGSTARVEATAPGVVHVRIEVQRGERTDTATRCLRIGIAELPAGRSIAADGTLDAAPEVAGPGSESFFDPAYLVTVDDPDGAIEAGTVDDRRVQPAVAARIRALLERVSLAGGTGVLRLADGWRPGAPGLTGVGRAVTLDPAGLTLPPQRLAALAHAVGFTHVRHEAGLVRIRHEADALVTVTGPDEVTEEEPARYTIVPRAVASAAAASAGLLYVACAGTDLVSELDTATGTVRRAFKVGAAPAAVAVSPREPRLYSADAGSSTITTVDLTSGRIVGALDVGGNPAAIRHHPTAARLYAAVPGLAALLEIDTAGTPRVLRSRALPPFAEDLALTADGGEAWVVLSQARRVAVVDTATMTVKGAAVPIQNTPSRIAVSAARAYVTSAVAQQLTVLDLASRAVVAVAGNVGSSPEAVAVSADGATVYVADPADGGLYLRGADGAAATFVPLGGAPVHVEPTPAAVYVVRKDTDNGLSTDDVSVFAPGVPARVLAAWPLGAGNGERLSWSLQAGLPARGVLSSTTKPEVDVRPVTAGPVALRASYLWPQPSPPRTFRIGLSPAVRAKEAAGTPVRLDKDDYDLVMNVLNTLHPVGVEIGTAELRAHVAELADARDVFPGYTYPDFRTRRPVPVRRTPSP